MSITPTQSNIQAAMIAFIATALPGLLVVSGQGNRVPEPQVGDFVVLTPIFFDRIETNFDMAADCRFVGSINANTMAVNSLQIGTVVVGTTVFGTGVAPGTTVGSQLTGSPGQVGTYMVTPSQTVPNNTVMSTGQTVRQQNMEWRVQLDFHSTGLEGGDMAATFVTQYRSVFATTFFESQGLSIDSLYADEARQIPFINAEQQYEWRWVVEAILQANHLVTTPQQYADAVTVNLINVPAAYGP